MLYSMTSVIAHFLLVLPALLGGIPQPSILSPSCQMSNVWGNSENTFLKKLKPYAFVQSQDVCTSKKLTYNKL